MLAWIDLETTGLDYKTCQILEVAIVITDNDLNEVCAESYVLPFTREVLPGENVVLAGKNIDPYVIAMHEKNGLWKECEEQIPQYLGASRVAEVLIEESLLTMMRQFTEPRTVPMCGSTIAFDRLFLREHMPRLEKHFHYRNVDVSTIGELAARWYPEIWDKRPKGDAHRALPDIRGSIELARYWRSEIMR